MCKEKNKKKITISKEEMIKKTHGELGMEDMKKDVI